MTEKETAIYEWIEACPEACSSFRRIDNTIVVEIELEDENDDWPMPP